MVFRFLPALIVLLCVLPPSAFAADVWHDEDAVASTLKKFSRSKRTEMKVIGKSAGGRELRLLTIHPTVRDDRPGVLVLANPEGHTPLATEAALALIGELLHVDGGVGGDARWYILPCANPDAAAHFFAKPRHETRLNASAVDEDMDGLVGEDGPEDLDGDGIIAQLLVPDPGGRFYVHESGLAVEAEPGQGLVHTYRLESEGRDDDGDGRWNEDGPGGVSPARNFPHRFKHWTRPGGLWAADQPETRAILEFAHQHPDIGMILVLGRVNNLRVVPEASQQGLDGRYPAPEKYAERWGLKPGEKRTLDEYRQILSQVQGLDRVRDHLVLRYLEEDAATAIDVADHRWWQTISREYQDFLKKNGMTESRLPSATSGPGSPEEWGYYQFGVPTFALDFWSLPCKAAADSSTLVSEDEEEDPLSDIQRALVDFGGRILPWTQTEAGLVGGVAPFALATPPAAQVDSLLRAPVRYLSRLPGWLPRLELAPVQMESRGGGVHQVTAWVSNAGRLPYPTAQGVRTGRIPPVVVELEGAEVLDGRPRVTLERIPGHGSVPVRWLVRARKGERLVVRASAPSLGTVERKGGAK